MANFLTADYHLGEDRMEILGRPFKSTQEMIDTLVQNHNELVSKDDVVYFAGDAVYQKADPSFIEQINRFNGRKILFRGNHDRPFTDEQFGRYFVEIVPEGEGKEIEIDGLPCWITHYPTRSRHDRFNLVGHIHSAWKVQLNMLNVGVDVNHFRPMPFEKVPFFYKAICEFYDEDVWTAYNPNNLIYLGRRGKKGNYFDGQAS